ncbi:MAG: Hsp20 family protein [Alphaproteobacteria bacterium]|nr:Hsp20 family protein [Rhodospirillaceae bacterium]MBT6509927.1 Hsp20 family protein [Rhodospirillaceae bacterium]MBT7613058.1 Hsp20 family protein [Rhodospirillaceae bacterium]MDG2480651.1 Hsp20 family protein [Alphaproteobacteria bacterium]
MTRFDFSPLFRSTVGYDRVMHALEANSRAADEGYPPYNIEKVDENDYRITMALAGFGEDDLDIEVKDATVTVSGEIAQTKDEGRTYLHRGIAGRSFKRTFQLADHVRVSGAALENGLLHIDLVREVPEALKPRTIEIRSADTARQIAA